MEIVSGYRDDAALRASFNRLAEKTFGLNFEGWYQNGFWTERYNPYSIVEGGEVVANVSVNRMDMRAQGQNVRLVQLGTVMTDEAYRRRGLIRTLMERIDADCADADGIYLFAGPGVLDFYPKFGFRQEKEFVYTRDVAQGGAVRVRRLPMNGPDDWKAFAARMAASRCAGALDMADNPQLIFFYVSQFMQENVFVCDRLDAAVIAECKDGELTIHNVFAEHEAPLDAVIACFGADVRRVTLGFTPADASSWQVSELREEDTTFFAKGPFFENFSARRLRFPTLSHA